jgi:hypothetical protein
MRREGGVGVSLGTQSGLVVLLTWVLYLGGGMLLMARRKPFRAGVAMAATAMLPLLWQVLFTDSDAPGFVFFGALLLMPAVLVMLLGVVAAVYRLLYPDGEWA